MRPFMAATRYVNYLNDDEGDDPAAAAYGPNYPRLRAIKTKSDPMNVFHNEPEHSAGVNDSASRVQVRGPESRVCSP